MRRRSARPRRGRCRPPWRPVAPRSAPRCATSCSVRWPRRRATSWGRRCWCASSSSSTASMPSRSGPRARRR
ncbi:hypothetical protein DFH01_12670 [Falsiroseomonas bella]|uniref:Uncharacterized protein n=1 Tax=Falsiroseomonas bella TaxID=2184016 RepID=A0A317FJH0_9PROT|nr:hypothetical protein DFH01_12670 [Falsiroseomonas bella]